MNIYGHNLDLTDKKLQKKGIDYILIKHFKDYPFFTNLLLNSSDIEDISEKNPNSLAYTFFNYKSERIKICLNFNKLENGINKYKFKEEDIFNIIVHELLHNYFEHLLRFKTDFQKYPELTNCILDYYVNDFILEIYPSFSNLINSLGLINYDYLNNLANFLTEEDLPFSKNEKKKPLDKVLLKWFIDNLKEDKLNSINSAKKFSDLDSHEIGREEELKSLEELNQEREKDGKNTYSEDMAETIKTSFLKSKVYESKSSGKDGEAFERELEKIYKKDTFLDFIKIKNSIKTICKKNYFFTYSKSNRKKIVDDIIFKGKKQEEGVKLVIAIDVSGSISEKELETFYNMVSTFLESGYSENLIDVIYWSSMKLTEANIHKNISTYKQLFNLKIETNGGTDVSTLYNFIKKEYKNIKITLLNITDGYWNNENLPENIVDYFLALTTDETFEDKSKFYRKAKIRIYNRI